MDSNLTKNCMDYVFGTLIFLREIKKTEKLSNNESKLHVVTDAGLSLSMQ